MQVQPAAHPGAIPAEEAGDAVRGVQITPQQAHGVSETSTGASAKAEGLPQFRFEYWGGQIAWLVVIFAVLYVLLARVFTPRLRRVRDAREQAIGGAIEDARRVRAEADAQARAAQSEMAEARARAQGAAADAKARVNAEAAARHAAQEAELGEKLSAAETRIRASRDAAMGSVRQVASETAAAIVDRLTGQGASPEEVDAALAASATQA